MPLFGGNATAVEALYEQYLHDAGAVPSGWRDYFDTLGAPDTEIAHSPIREDLLIEARSGRRRKTRKSSGKSAGSSSGEKQAAVSRLIQVYALRGHQIAKIDPLGLMERPVPGVLRLDYLGLTEADMDTEFHTGGLAGTGDERMKLRDIIALLKSIYCGTLGAEFAHMSRSPHRLWPRKRLHQGSAAPPPSPADRPRFP